MSLYALAHVGRAGLGNSLLPWARAEVFAKRTGAALLVPRWAQPRIGPYLRGEPDKRWYYGYFHSQGYVRGWKSLALRAFARRVREDGADALSPSDGGATLVEFEGFRGLFAPILGQRSYVKERLWKITRECYRAATGGDGRFVAMHVRRGDLTRQGFRPEELPSVLQYTPLSWFKSMAAASRESPVLKDLPIVVFTDGSPDEVAELARLPGVQLRGRQPSIADLWALSRARVLFGSGYSTFSMWASFLGGMPSVYAPGKLAQRVLAEESGSVELELAEGAAIPAGVASHPAVAGA